MKDSFIKYEQYNTWLDSIIKREKKKVILYSIDDILLDDAIETVYSIPVVIRTYIIPYEQFV